MEVTVNSSFFDIRCWRRFLLEDPIAAGLAELLPDHLKQVSLEFLGRVDSSPGPSSCQLMDHWYASRDGQQVMDALLSRLWNDMAKDAKHAMPAHDKRHAMFKVPAAALEYMDAERVDGWGRLGLVSSLMHDRGRWAEERIWGGPQQSLVHARLSYVLGKEFLQDFDVPAAVADQILLATVRHTSGAGIQDTMPQKITVSADRAQLIGAEIVIRLLHHPPMPNGDLSSYLSDSSGHSVLDRLYHFATTKIPGPLFALDGDMTVLVDGLVDVLLLSEDEDSSRRRFLSAGNEKRAFLEAGEWRRRWDAAQELPIHCGTALQEATALLSAPHLAAGHGHIGNALNKLPPPSDDRSIRVGRALAHARHLRMSEDDRQFARLTRIIDLYADDALSRRLAGKLIAEWDCDPLSD